MSGFGIRAFKKVKDENTAKEKRQFFKHIVYGENTYGILTFFKLNQKYPGEVKLICNNPFFKDDLINEWNTTLNSVRSEDVAHAMTSLNPRFEVLPINSDVMFYKDAKFHKYGGRAKPHELKEGESFFTANPYRVKWDAMFTGDELEKMDEILSENQFQKILNKIEICTPEDLVEKVNFKLHTGEYETFECEKLYFCESPKTFFGLVENKELLPEAIHKYTATLSNHQAIAVHFKCDKQVFETEGTVVLPQSVTHEWGSFMLDFESFSPDTNTQNFKALTFLSEDDVQEEDLAKKIKLMKRVIERVMPEFGKADVKQSIRFSPEYRISGVDDELFDSLQNCDVRFLGQAAPIKIENSEHYQYMARGLNSILSIEL